MMSIPSSFPQYDLSSDLALSKRGINPGIPVLLRPDDKSTLPGQPWIDIGTHELLPYLRNSHLVDSLNKAASYLWLAGTPSETHVFPLHHQIARGRKIVSIEEPGLHAIWYQDKIFLKPIPRYLFCRAFWEYVSEVDSGLWQAVAGFMRTYCYLIRHEIDFNMAIDPALGLIPILDDPSFDSFVRFISQFKDLDNSQVVPRYSYGMLRLTRLNMMAPILMGKLTYFHINSQWTDYFGSVFPPLLTVFAIMSTILNSMQVELAVEGLDASVSWPRFTSLCRWVAVCVIVLIVIIMGAIMVFFGGILVKEFVFARSFIHAKRMGRSKELQAVVTARTS